VNTNDNTKQNPRCLLRVRAKNTGVEITRVRKFENIKFQIWIFKFTNWVQGVTLCSFLHYTLVEISQF